MNIELQVKNLYANVDKLEETGFIADFYYIAKEYARQQNLQQTPCTTQLPNDYCEWCKGICKMKNVTIYDED
jgi:hypothetical protein